MLILIFVILLLGVLKGILRILKELISNNPMVMEKVMIFKIYGKLKSTSVMEYESLNPG